MNSHTRASRAAAKTEPARAHNDGPVNASVQSQLDLQQAFDGSPRVVAQAKLADALNGVVQRVAIGEDDIGKYFLIPHPSGRVRARLLRITPGGRGIFEPAFGGQVSVHPDNVVPIDEESDEDVQKMDEEEPEITEENLTFESARKFLEKSTEYEPLPKEKLEMIEKFYGKHMTQLKREESRKFGNLLKIAKDDLKTYDLLTSTKRKMPKKRRKKTEKEKVHTFGKEDESEISDEESDMDKRWKKYPTVMAPISGRSHVPGIEDAKPSLRSLSSGLPYRDTYLGLFKEGSLVPRLVNDKPNVQGHRKRMGDVQKNVESSLGKRDSMLKTLEKTKEDISSKKFKGPELEKLLDEEKEKTEQIKLELATKVRPHIENVLFGSSLKPTEEDIKETEDVREQRSKIKKAIISAPTTSGILTSAPYERDVMRPEGTDTHAEQSLLATRMWKNLVTMLIKAIGSNKDKPEEIEKQSFTSLHLALNRSTCIGCARELSTELIRFWTLVAEITGLSDWREAKFVYEDYVDFTVSFPSIYEVRKEKNIEYRNFNRIILGLIDAGWRVHVTTGIEGSEEAEESNEDVKKRVRALSGIPQFFVKGWNPKIVRFPIPDALKKAVDEHGEVLINGIYYWETKDGKLTRDDDVKKDSVSSEQLKEATFARTGTLPESGDEKKEEEKKKKSGLSEKYALYGELDELQYDEQLQEMLLNGYGFQNVPGTGMNCLIRAIFTAAGIRYDEAMVKIVRQFLIDLGVAEAGDMLDLLDVEGDSLIHFTQAQGVLGGDTGITVHFPGDRMQVVNGGKQLHLWFDHAHFQAIVKK